LYWVCSLQAHTEQQFLFDSVASPSFISSTFVAKHHLPCQL
jgi:hypothetical protein